jgi:hypothetical protein
MILKGLFREILKSFKRDFIRFFRDFTLRIGALNPRFARKALKIVSLRLRKHKMNNCKRNIL